MKILEKNDIGQYTLLINEDIKIYFTDFKIKSYTILLISNNDLVGSLIREKFEKEFLGYWYNVKSKEF